MKLTAKRIEQITFQGAYYSYQDIHWDDDLQTFGIRVYPTNAKSFVISYWSRGRKRLHTLGKVGVYTLDQARKMAKIALAHRNEIDPADERRAMLKAPTFGDLAESYLENHASKNRSYSDDKRRIEKRLLPKWKNRKLDSITHRDVQELHRSIGSEILERKSGSKPKHYEANRTLALIRSMFNRATTWEMLKADHRNPATGISQFEEEERDRWLTDKEMKAMADAIQQISNIYIRGAIWLALLTGQRKEELLKAKWSQFDPASMTLSLPTTKGKRPHVVPITPAAKAVIEAMPKKEGNAFIFCGRVKGNALVNPYKSWNKVIALAKVENVRFHDLRRSVGTWLGLQGESVATVKSLLNHKDIRTTLRYMRSAKAQERQALETSSRKLRPMIGSIVTAAAPQSTTPEKRRIRLRKPQPTDA